MYEHYFNLQLKPFDLLPDPRFIYQSRSYKKALTYLDYGIRERSGFILLTGEVGSGKTTLIRDLIEKHYEHVVLSKVFNTHVTSEQLLAMINDDFGLSVQGKDKVTLIRDLNDFLIDQFACGNQPILIIDEAQNLSRDLLEEVRMLSNLEASTGKLLQIILIGQPELRDILAVPELRQLRQRININCHLLALTRDEVERYITRRLEVAGNKSAVLFSAEALDAIFKYSQGIPRLINIMCDFLMLSAFAEEAAMVTVDMVQDVVGDLDFENYYWMTDVPEAVPNNAEHEKSSVAVDHALTYDPQNMLAEISRRLEAIEQTIVAPLHTAFKEQNERFESFQSTVQSHVAKTNSNILFLNKKLEELTVSITSTTESLTQEPPHQQVSVQEPPKVSFVRRVLGVAASNHGK